MMSVIKLLPQGRSVLFRDFTASRAICSILCAFSTTLPQRHYSSSVRFQQEAIRTPATGSEVPLTATRRASPANNARSIAITKLPKRVVKADIEQLLRSAGVDVKRIQLRVDRFTFFSDSSCFIELGSEQQAQKVIETLNGQQLQGSSLVVRPIKETFYWDQGFKKDARFFFHDDQTPSQAIQPLIEGRRYALQVENPGWVAPEGSGKSANTTRREIIDNHFGPFGVEVIGALNPIWRSQKKDHPFLAHIDFVSKEAAEQAAKALNNTEIEGKRVYLQASTVNSSKAKQIGNVDQGALAQLQEGGFIDQTSTQKVGA